MRPFHGKQLARYGTDVFLISGVDAIAPLASLEIEILPAGEPAAGKKVVFDTVISVVLGYAQ
jgi:hypothetical protein